jgi:hypothetical protein
MVIINLKHNDSGGVIRRKIMKKISKKSNNFKIFILKILIDILNLCIFQKKILIFKK